jgi:hypothetical protein
VQHHHRALLPSTTSFLFMLWKNYGVKPSAW